MWGLVGWFLRAWNTLPASQTTLGDTVRNMAKEDLYTDALVEGLSIDDIQHIRRVYTGTTPLNSKG
jgi:hypothetical protein